MTLLLHGLQKAASGASDALPPHRHIEAAGLRALCSPAPAWMSSETPEDSDEERMIAAALDHDRLLRAALATGDVLPVRFGSLFSGSAALEEALMREADRHHAGLARVASAQEVGLVLHRLPQGEQDPASAPCGSSGRDFLAARRRARDRRGDLSKSRSVWFDGFERSLSELAREILPRSPREERVADLALLVPLDRFAGLEAMIETERARAAATGLGLTLSEPMPPYSFAEPADDAGAPEARSPRRNRDRGSVLHV